MQTKEEKIEKVVLTGLHLYDHVNRSGLQWMVGTDFSGTHLTATCLSKADYHDEHISGVCLNSVYLKDTNFRASNVKGTHLALAGLIEINYSAFIVKQQGINNAIYQRPEW